MIAAQNVPFSRLSDRSFTGDMFTSTGEGPRNEVAITKQASPFDGTVATSSASVSTGDEVIRNRVLDALESLMKFDGDLELRAQVRRRYVDLTTTKES